jgi:hypothetical protein
LTTDDAKLLHGAVDTFVHTREGKHHMPDAGSIEDGDPVPACDGRANLHETSGKGWLTTPKAALPVSFIDPCSLCIARIRDGRDPRAHPVGPTETVSRLDANPWSNNGGDTRTISRTHSGPGYAYYRCRSGGDDITLYEHQLVACLEHDPHEVFAEETDVHHTTPVRDLNLPRYLEVVDKEEHRSRGGDCYVDESPDTRA